MVRNHLIVRQIAEYLEAEMQKYGRKNDNGDRIVAMSINPRALAMEFGVSLGTFQNSIRALKNFKYVITFDPGYVRLRKYPITETELRQLEKVTPDSKYVSTRPEVEEVKKPTQNYVMKQGRLPEPIVKHAFKSIMGTDGIRSAVGFVESHRRWCSANGFQPYL